MKNEQNFLKTVTTDFLKTPIVKPIEKSTLKNVIQTDLLTLKNAIKSAVKIDVNKLVANDIFICKNDFLENNVAHATKIIHIEFDKINPMNDIFFCVLRNNLFIVTREYIIHHAVKKIPTEKTLIADKFFTLNPRLIKKHIAEYPDDTNILKNIYKFDTANL